MAVAIQHAAGGAFLSASSSPAAADFTRQAVAAAAPRLLRLMHQRHASSAPRALHTLLHRPSLLSASGATLRRPAATGASSPRLFNSYVYRPAGANKTMPAMMGASRSFSSHDKYNNQLQEEEAKMKRKKELAMALMNHLPTAPAGAADHGEEIKGIDNLFGLLDVPDGTAVPSSVNEQAERMHAKLRSLVETRKDALLIELLKDGDAREEKKAELVEAGRRLRDALVEHDERRAFLNLSSELKSLKYNYKRLSDSVAAGRIEFESANANADAIRADVSRLGDEVKSIKNEDGKVERLEELVAKCRKEAEAAYGLALFCGCTATATGILAALHIF